MLEKTIILKKIYPTVLVLSLFLSGCYFGTTEPYATYDEGVGDELKKRIYSINKLASNKSESLLLQLKPETGTSSESNIYTCREKDKTTRSNLQVVGHEAELIKYKISNNKIIASTTEDYHYTNSKGEEIYLWSDKDISFCKTIPEEMLRELEVIENRLKILHITSFPSYTAGLEYVKSIEPTDEEFTTYMNNIELYYDSIISSNKQFLSLYLNDVNRRLFGKSVNGVDYNRFFNKNFGNRIKDVEKLNTIYLSTNSSYSEFSELVNILEGDVFKGLNLKDLNNYYNVALVEDGTSKLYKHNGRFIGVQDSTVTVLYDDHLSEYHSIDEKFITKAKNEIYLDILSEYESTLSDSTFHVTSKSINDAKFAQCLEQNISEMVDEDSRVRIEKECTAASTDTEGYYKENVLFTEKHDFQLKLEEQILIDGISLQAALGYNKNSHKFYVQINSKNYQLDKLFKINYNDLAGLLQNRNPELDMQWVSESSFISNKSDVR